MFVTDKANSRFNDDISENYINHAKPIKWLTDLGVAAIIDYYEQEYGVRIIRTRGTAKIRELVDASNVINPDQDIRLGFSLNDGCDHYTPAIYIKERDPTAREIKQDVFISDSLGEEPLIGEKFLQYCKEHKITINIDASISGPGRIRQAAIAGCKTDSLVWLKDALRLDKSKFKITGATSLPPVGTRSPIDVMTFDPPEDLMKTAQISSYLALTGADESARLETTSMAKKSRPPKASKTLGAKRAETRRTQHYRFYKEGLPHPEGDRDFTESTYLLDKGYRYEEIIRERYLGKSEAELLEIKARAEGADILAKAAAIKRRKDLEAADMASRPAAAQSSDSLAPLIVGELAKSSGGVGSATYFPPSSSGASSRGTESLVSSVQKLAKSAVGGSGSYLFPPSSAVSGMVAGEENNKSKFK